MSKVIPEPSPNPARNYLSQLCLVSSGRASGALPLPEELQERSAAYLMGRRDAFHVVVAHLASSRSLREAAEKSAAFGRGVRQHSATHPYGADWCEGFAGAALEASADIMMYAASGCLPRVDRILLEQARVAVRKVNPFPGSGWVAPSALGEPPVSRREW